MILFDSLWWVDVAGKIDADGTAEQPIIFSTAYREPEMGQWRGFKLHNATEVSRFEHCIFTYGAFFDTDTTSSDARIYKGMLAINNSSPVIERCVVFRNQNNAVYITGANSHPRIRFNIFFKNDASAVRTSLGDVRSRPGVHHRVQQRHRQQLALLYRGRRAGRDTTALRHAAADQHQPRQLRLLLQPRHLPAADEGSRENGDFTLAVVLALYRCRSRGRGHLRRRQHPRRHGRPSTTCRCPANCAASSTARWIAATRIPPLLRRAR